MRKIEQNMLDAIREGRNWQEGNTAVRWDDDNTGTVTLHGNLIAVLEPDGSVLPVRRTFAQWPTRTTVSRLRALGIDARVKDGKAMIDGKPI